LFRGMTIKNKGVWGIKNHGRAENKRQGCRERVGEGAPRISLKIGRQRQGEKDQKFNAVRSNSRRIFGTMRLQEKKGGLEGTQQDMNPAIQTSDIPTSGRGDEIKGAVPLSSRPGEETNGKSPGPIKYDRRKKQVMWKPRDRREKYSAWRNQ